MKDEFLKGLWKENPIFVLLLGLCPTLAVTTSLVNGIGMGLATTFVLLCSNLLVSLLKDYIPNKVRIPSFIVIIATFVTIADLFMQGFMPALSKQLSIFVPLIVVNCVVLGRAEVFASKEPTLLSLLDALGMGLGFTLALGLIGAIREILGAGELLGYSFGAAPLSIMILAPGAFLVVGLLLALFRHISRRKAHD